MAFQGSIWQEVVLLATPVLFIPVTDTIAAAPHGRLHETFETYAHGLYEQPPKGLLVISMANYAHETVLLSYCYFPSDTFP